MSARLSRLRKAERRFRRIRSARGACWRCVARAIRGTRYAVLGEVISATARLRKRIPQGLAEIRPSAPARTLPDHITPRASGLLGGLAEERGRRRLGRVPRLANTSRANRLALRRCAPSAGAAVRPAVTGLRTLGKFASDSEAGSDGERQARVVGRRVGLQRTRPPWNDKSRLGGRLRSGPGVLLPPATTGPVVPRPVVEREGFAAGARRRVAVRCWSWDCPDRHARWS